LGCESLQSGLKFPAFSDAAVDYRLEFPVFPGKFNQNHSLNPYRQIPAIRLRNLQSFWIKSESKPEFSISHGLKNPTTAQQALFLPTTSINCQS